MIAEPLSWANRSLNERSAADQWDSRLVSDQLWQVNVPKLHPAWVIVRGHLAWFVYFQVRLVRGLEPVPRDPSSVAGVTGAREVCVEAHDLPADVAVGVVVGGHYVGRREVQQRHSERVGCVEGVCHAHPSWCADSVRAARELAHVD